MLAKKQSLMWLTWCQFSADEGEVGRTVQAGDKSPGAPLVSQLLFSSTPLVTCPRWLAKGNTLGTALTPDRGLAADLGSSLLLTLDIAQGEGAAWALQRVTQLQWGR